MRDATFNHTTGRPLEPADVQPWVIGASLAAGGLVIIGTVVGIVVGLRRINKPSSSSESAPNTAVDDTQDHGSTSGEFQLLDYETED